MNNIRKVINGFVKVVIVMLLICSIGVQFSDQWGIAHAYDQGGRLGDVAPIFSLQDIDGKQYTVGGSDAPKKKPIWIHFWASWCQPCQLEASAITSLASEYEEELDVYAINVTMYDNLKDAKDFVKKNNYTFPVLMDEQADIYQQFRGAALPTHVLIDGNGIIKDYVVGALPKEQLEKKIKALVKSQ